MSVELLPAYDHRDEIAALFGEYTRMLVAGDESFQEYLTIQNYDDELVHLEHKYGLPDGRLYIAMEDGAALGCVGLRRLDGESCELKRMYVRPEYRGRGLSKVLLDRVIADAREIGYKAMLLDTLPFLEAAIALYRKYGFYEIPCYNDSPVESTIFMRLDL
ncbi:MAG: GNAT family N-acetyltransferase [Oscillospiraceae bacterium]|nr:GNAT family N-acetyltransferase [Oscillospiraceae bacterium]